MPPPPLSLQLGNGPQSGLCRQGDKPRRLQLAVTATSPRNFNEKAVRTLLGQTKNLVTRDDRFADHLSLSVRRRAVLAPTARPSTPSREACRDRVWNTPRKATAPTDVADLPFVNIGFEPLEIFSTRVRARKPPRPVQHDRRAKKIKHCATRRQCAAAYKTRPHAVAGERWSGT
jgi:hypothetical protein